MDDRLGTRGLAARMARGAPHVAAFLAAAAILAVVVVRLPGPVVDRLIESDFRTAAQVWQMRILRQLRAGARTFTTGGLAADDIAFLSAITHASDFHRLSLLDAEGRVFWSSRPELIGSLHHGEEGGSGEVEYHLETVPVTEIDDFDLHVLGSDSDGLRHVAEIVQPVTLDGRVTGDIEFYRDITSLREASLGRVRTMIGAVAGFALVMVAGVSIVLMRAGRAQMRAAHARSEAQARHMAEQERLAREVRLLGELNEWLQSCRSLPELFSMVARFMQHILPGASGSLYVYSNSRDVLEGAASWNGAQHDDHIRPEDCWGLRRGRTYAFGQSEVDFACAHVHFDVPRRYVCIPILAHGETIGLMTLTRKAATSQAAFEAQRRIAQTCAEQISLAIANVRMRDELHHQAVRDPLTGLFNRRHMLDALRRLIDHRHPGGVAVVSVDVDHFKLFNDNHGHDAGDVVLRSVSEVLSRHADTEGIACRTGGEELLILWPGVDMEEARRRAEALRAEVAGLAVRYGDKVLPRVTISIGLAHSPSHGAMPQEVIRAADEALYVAKNRGRNQVASAGEERDADPAEVGAATGTAAGAATGTAAGAAPVPAPRPPSPEARMAADGPDGPDPAVGTAATDVDRDPDGNRDGDGNSDGNGDGTAGPDGLDALEAAIAALGPPGRPPASDAPGRLAAREPTRDAAGASDSSGDPGAPIRRAAG